MDKYWRRRLSFIRSVVAAFLCLIVLVQCKPDAKASVESSGNGSVLTEINDRIRSHPDDADAYMRRAVYHRDSANYGDAILDMAYAMQLDSVNLEYHVLLSDIYLRDAKSQFAINTLERGVLLFPDSTRALLKLAEVYLVVRQYDKVSSSLRKILTIDPQNTAALHLLGLMYQEQGNMERAVQTYQTITELNSEDPEAWTMLGNLYDMEDDPRALQCFENAIQIDPRYVQGWHSKAYYLQNHDRIPEAIQIYRQIHEIDPAYSDAWLNRGILYLEMDSTAQALSCFEQLIVLDSTSARGYYYAGVAAGESGDKDKARAYLNRALNFEPSSPRIKQAIQDLQ